MKWQIWRNDSALTWSPYALALVPIPGSAINLFTRDVGTEAPAFQKTYSRIYGVLCNSCLRLVRLFLILRAGATEDYGRRDKESVTRIPETNRLTQLPNSNRPGGHGVLTPETDRLTQLQGSVGAAGAQQRSVWAHSLLHSGFLNADSEVTVTTDPTVASVRGNFAWDEPFVLGKPFSSRPLNHPLNPSLNHPLNPSLNHPLNHQLNHPLAFGAPGHTAKSGGLFGLARLSHTHHLAGNEKKVAEGKRSVVGEDFTRLNTFLGDHFAMVFPQFSDEELEHNILFLHEDSLQASHLHSTDLPPMKRNNQPPDLQDSPFLSAEDLQDSPFLSAEDLQDSHMLPAEEGKQLPEKRSGWSLSLNSADDLQLLSVLNKNILSLDAAQYVQLPDLQSVEMVFNV